MEIHEPTIDLKYQKFKTENGAVCPVYVAKTKKAKQLSGYVQIMDDLRHSILLIENLGDEQLAEIEKAIWSTAVMLYGKCFASAEGRRIKLEKSHVQTISSQAVDYHVDLMTLRNKYLAHACGTSMEQSETLVILNPEKEGKGIRYIAHTTVAKFRVSKNEKSNFIDHVKALFQVVSDRVDEIHPIILAEHQSMDLGSLYRNTINA